MLFIDINISKIHNSELFAKGGKGGAWEFNKIENDLSVGPKQSSRSIDLENTEKYNGGILVKSLRS